MAKFKSNICSEKSQEDMNRIIAGYLGGKGYSRFETKQGAKGNRWAWEKNHYDSPERYMAKQKKWVQAWSLIIGGLFVFALILPILVSTR